MLNEIHYSSEMHGTIVVDSTVFRKLDPKYFITSCTDDVKYMCNNYDERVHLREIGITIGTDMLCDWYEIVRAED